MENDAQEQIDRLKEAELSLEAERRLRDQQLQTINQAALVVNMALKALSNKSLIFFSLLGIFFLFAWVMVSPDLIRLVSAVCASVTACVITKLDWKSKE